MNSAQGRGSGPPPMDATTPAPLEATGLVKTFETAAGDGELRVLQGVDLRVESGEAVAIIGQSGAGKSTLLNLLGALDRPTSGDVLVGGEPIGSLDEDALAAVRNRHVGFVFQFHHLLKDFTALENVMMPCLVGGVPRDEAQERARDLLDSVGLSHRLGHKPGQLSGGEQQRVAVARAIANRPLVLLADEPSGNLDGPTSEQLHDVLFRIKEERRLSMVVVTHNQELADRCDRILHMRTGRLHDVSYVAPGERYG